VKQIKIDESYPVETGHRVKLDVCGTKRIDELIPEGYTGTVRIIITIQETIEE
jgi:hypothetical protein